MSEADKPTNPNSPSDHIPQNVDPIPSTDDAIADPHTEDEEWETLDFPNAIAIDALLEGSEETEGIVDAATPSLPQIQTKQNRETSPQTNQSGGWVSPSLNTGSKSPTPEAQGNPIPQLQQENQELTGRVEQLETLLHECRQSLQQQRSQALERQKLLDRRTTELQAATASLKQQSHQIQVYKERVQQQENLVENLSTELQTSLERLAKLERECAVTQQNYNEQSQLLLQSQTTCRDLRARLHRQQRHTLQFKAALEKCIEMPLEKAETLAALRQSTAEETADSSTSTEAIDTATSPATGIVPKANPIRPWSAATEEERVRDRPLESKPLGNLSKVQLPLSAVGNSHGRRPPEVKPLDVPTASQSPRQNMKAGDRTIEQPLWEDLDPLIETPTYPRKSDRIGVPSEPIPPAIASTVKAAAPVSPLSDRQLPAARKPEPLLTGNSEEQLLLKAKAYAEQLQTPVSPASADPSPVPQAESIPQPSTSSLPPNPTPSNQTQSSSSPIWPAPVVHPLRSGDKKRRSFSAVELPSFSNKK